MSDRYTYRALWSQEDQMYVGLCAEFSLLSALGQTLEETFSGIRQVVSEAVAILQEDGDPMSTPSDRAQGGP